MTTTKPARMTTSNYWFDLEPVPASRPRIRTFKAKNGAMISSAYYAGKYKKFMTEAETAIQPAQFAHQGNLEVEVVCVVTKPKTTKRPNPNGDVDNYAKGVLDIITKKGYWEDDMQIVKLTVIKTWAGEGNDLDPGFSVEITEVDY